MIFKQYLKVLTGEKTETRRVAHDGENAMYFDGELKQVRAIITASKTVRFEVWKTYPIIPKMFSAAIWWRRSESTGQLLTRCGVEYRPSWDAYNSEYDYENTHRIDSRNYLHELGYKQGRIRILALRWREPLHSIDDAGAIREGVSCVDEYRELWESINGKKRKYRWIANPLVNVIGFEVVR